MSEQKKTASLDNRKKALELALAQIEKQFGKGSIMKMDESTAVDIDNPNPLDTLGSISS